MALVNLILESAQNGAGKTEIMRNVNLNYNRANRYCQMLLANGLLIYNPSDQTFETSPKGKYVLKASNELFQYLQPVKQMIERYRINPVIA